MAPSQKTLRLLASALSLLWAGALLGVSFIATPAKFWAHSLTLPVALDVGRQTFQFFNKLELGALVALGILLFSLRQSGFPRALVVLIAGLLALQFLWLLPALDQRVAVFLSGAVPPESPLHKVYIACDVWKLVLLIALPWLLEPAAKSE